ncbi:MAG: hypothetical protein Q8L78_04765 [Coxiellaceae bacterium]|nr:hypothetical protein [Coxiellaceae bacterium]
MRKKVSEFTLNLQRQRIVPLWALLNDDVIYSNAINEKFAWKNKSKKIHSAMRIAEYLKITDVLIFMVGLFKIALSLNKIKNKKLKNGDSSEIYKKIFVGHGANAEKFIFDEYKLKAKESILVINVITLEGFEKICVPRLFFLLKSLFKNAFGLSAKIGKLSFFLKHHKQDFLTVAALNIGEYVLFKHFFSAAKSKGIDEITFLALHVAAHSCIHEKIKMTYWSHGLIKLSIPMIKPDQVFVLTTEEKRHVEFLFDNKINCNLIKNYEYFVEKKENKVIFISPEDTLAYSDSVQKNIFLFFQWCRFESIEIILRPSPKITESNMLKLEQKFGNVKIDKLDQNFDARLKEIKPKYVVGFNSTGMFTAFSMGILPISFCDPDPNSKKWNMIYPMNRQVLFWPKDQNIIKETMQAELDYHSVLSRLRVDNSEFISV